MIHNKVGPGFYFRIQNSTCFYSEITETEWVFNGDKFVNRGLAKSREMMVHDLKGISSAAYLTCRWKEVVCPETVGELPEYPCGEDDGLNGSTDTTSLDMLFEKHGKGMVYCQDVFIAPSNEENALVFDHDGNIVCNLFEMVEYIAEKDGAPFQMAIKPCPFCGASFDIIETEGTFAETQCSDCGQASISIQMSDFMTIDERQDDGFDMNTSYVYYPRFRQRAIAIIARRLNRRI